MGTRVDEIRSLGGELLAVAVTPTFAQMAFGRHLGVDFPLVCDWDGAVAEAYGVRYDTWKEHRGVAKRSLFVIDRRGLIRYRWVTDDALVLPDLDELIEALRLAAEGAP